MDDDLLAHISWESRRSNNTATHFIHLCNPDETIDSIGETRLAAGRLIRISIFEYPNRDLYLTDKGEEAGAIPLVYHMDRPDFR